MPCAAITAQTTAAMIMGRIIPAMTVKAITAAARDAGVEWYNIEQDQTKRPVFESLQISIDYMRDVLHIQ